MGSFQAKIGWKRLRKRENKNYRSVTFLPVGLQKIPRKQQTNLKIPILQHFKPKQVGKSRERVKIKIIVPFRSYPNRNRKFQKSSKKIKKNTLMASSQAKIGWKRQRKRENKSYHSVSFLPDPQQKIPKKLLANSKN